MPRTITAHRPCRICGRTLRADNSSGICEMIRECRREKARIWRESVGIPPKLLHIRAGDRFGRLTVLADYINDGANIPCRCDCGTERFFRVNSLRKGDSTSCGCSRRKPQMKAKAPYIACGQIFVRLTALEDARVATDRIKFDCSCGSVTITTARLVKQGRTVSCGCKRRGAWLKHGLSKHPLYPTWWQMVARTTDPNHPSYADYGGRGIGTYKEWLGMPEGFAAFAEWVEANLGPRPGGSGPGAGRRRSHSLDRIDNFGSYEPGNLRWATWDQQRESQRPRKEMRAVMAQRDALLGLALSHPDPLVVGKARAIMSPTPETSS